MRLLAALCMLASPEGNVFEDAVLPLDTLFGTDTGASKVGKIVYGKLEQVEENPDEKGVRLYWRRGRKSLGMPWPLRLEASGLELLTSLIEKSNSPSGGVRWTRKLPGRRVFPSLAREQWAWVSNHYVFYCNRTSVGLYSDLVRPSN